MTSLKAPDALSTLLPFETLWPCQVCGRDRLCPYAPIRLDLSTLSLTGCDCGDACVTSKEVNVRKETLRIVVEARVAALGSSILGWIEPGAAKRRRVKP